MNLDLSRCLSVLTAAGLLTGVFSPQATAIARPMADAQFEQPSTLDRAAAPASPALVELDDDPTLKFNGTNQYVSVPHAAALEPTSEMTIEAWVFRRQNACETVIGKGFASSYWLGFCNGRIRFYSGGSGTFVDGVTDIPQGVWTHIAVTWRAGGQRAYFINGRLDYNGNALARSTNTQPLNIARDPSSGLYHFAGNIAEVRLWNVARSDVDIRETMHTRLEERRPGLIAVWHLNTDGADAFGTHLGALSGSPTPDSATASPARPIASAVDANLFTLTANPDHQSALVPRLNRVIVPVESTPLIYSIDPLTGDQRTASFPTALRGPAVAYADSNDTVYVFGGTGAGGRDQSTAYAVAPDTLAVRTVTARMPISFSAATAVFVPAQNKILITGLFISSGGGNTPHILVFDVGTETATGPIPLQLPYGISYSSAMYLPLNDKLYVLDRYADDVWEISVDWATYGGSVITHTNVAVGQGGFLKLVLDPQTQLIYVLGGTPGARFSIFDPVSAQSWKSPLTMPGGFGGAATYDARTRRVVVLGDTSAARPSWSAALGDGPALPVGTWRLDRVFDPVTSIAGADKRVVVGTETDGVYRYNGDTGGRTAFALAGSGRVNDTAHDGARDLSWVATEGGGLKRIDATGTISTLGVAELATTTVRAVSLGVGGTDLGSNPIIGTAGNGVKTRRFNPVIFPGISFWSWQTSFSSNTVAATAGGPDGSVYAVANGTLKRSTGFFPVESNLGAPCNLDVGDILYGPDGNWWFGSDTLGLDFIAAGGLCRALSPTGVPTGTSNLYDSFEIGPQMTSLGQAEGRVWAGADRGDTSDQRSGGLLQLAVVTNTGNITGRLQFEEYNWLNAPLGMRTFLTGDGRGAWDSGVTALAGVGEKIWLGNREGEVNTFAPRWAQLGESQNLKDVQVQKIALARGRAFISTNFNQVQVLDPDGTTWRTISGRVNAAVGDARGRLWLATNNGLRLWDGSNAIALPAFEGSAPTGVINALHIDAMGRLWIGHAAGLTLFDRERFVASFDTSNSGIPSNNVTALATGISNTLWVGTASGLARFNTGEWQTVTSANGLPSNSIADLAFTGDQQLAVSTAAGLVMLGASGVLTSGVPITPAANLPLTVDENGRLWAGPAAKTGASWERYYTTDSGLRYPDVADIASDGSERVWFAHGTFPNNGVSVRSSFLKQPSQVLPTISSFAPAVGRMGDVFTVTGSGFGTNAGNTRVMIGDAVAEVTSTSDTQIVGRITPQNGSGSVAVRAGGQFVRFGTENTFCATPVVSSVTPTGGNAGVPLQIEGANFTPGRMTVQMGTGPARFISGSATQLSTEIRSTDENGTVRVVNTTPGCGAPGANGFVNFRTIRPQLARMRMNQGYEHMGIMSGRSTLVHSYFTSTVLPRSTDRVEIDNIQLTFTPHDGGAEINQVFAYSQSVPLFTSTTLTDAVLTDIANSVNVWPTLPNFSGDRFSNGALGVTTRARYYRRGSLVAESALAGNWAQNRRFGVLVVPMMLNGYTPEELANFRANIWAGTEDFRRRMLPMGDVSLEFWPTPRTYMSNTVNIGDSTWLYDEGHDLEALLRRWNESHPDRRATTVYAVWDDRTLRQSGVMGFAMPGNIAAVLNAFIAPVDALCDIGMAIVRAFSLGNAGDADGCNLHLPVYVAWGRMTVRADGMATDRVTIDGVTEDRFRAGGSRVGFGATMAQEVGHNLGLVTAGQPNHAYSDLGGDANDGHSGNDELDFGNAANPGPRSQYNPNKTFHRFGGVTEPVVNPLTRVQIPPNLDAGSSQPRGKAVMAYVGGINNQNAFFEAPDITNLNAGFGLRDFAGFIQVVNGSTPALRESPLSLARGAIGQSPRARRAEGDRIYVSGTVNPLVHSGRIARVERLAPDAAVSIEMPSEWVLVQLDAANAELARVRLTVHGSDHDHSGAPEPVEASERFFSHNMIAKAGLRKIQLRHVDPDGSEHLKSEFAAGTSAPTVSVVSPAAGAVAGSSVPVSWLASDADGDALRVSIDFSPDGGTTWRVVGTAAGASGTVSVPVASLGGTSAGQMRVTVNDGFNSGSGTSAVFSIAPQPPSAAISAPTGQSVLEGERVMLRGIGFDPAQGVLAAGALSWRSNRDGALGTGDDLSALLSVGTHVITLTARNAANLSASATATVTVLGDYDFDGIADSLEQVGAFNLFNPTDAAADADGDGASNITELRRGTPPRNPDGDGDGQSDGREIGALGMPLGPNTPYTPTVFGVWPPTVALTANLALDVPFPQQVMMMLAEQATGWQMGANVPWLRATAITGTAPGDFTLAAIPAGLADGVHRATLTFTSTRGVVSVPLTLTVLNARALCDVDGDGRATAADTAIVTSLQGVNGFQPAFRYRADLDRSGFIDAADLRLVSACSGRRVMLPVVVR